MPKKKQGNRKRRGKKEGSVFQKPDGKWYAQISIQGLNGNRRRVTRTGNTKEHAVLLLSELQAGRPAIVAAGKVIYLADYLENWLELSIKPNRESATYSAWKNCIKNHISPHIGSMDIADLTADHVENWLKLIDEANIGQRTRQMSFTTLRHALNQAVKRRIIPFNPCMSVSPPKYEREEINPFTAFEVNGLIKETQETRLAAVFPLGLHAGLRQEEIFGLQWKDVDIENKTASIRQVAAEVSGKVEIKKPKTKAGKRRISLTASTIDALFKRKLAAEGEKLANATDFVLPSLNGSPTRRTNFRSRIWVSLLKKMGLTHRGFHQTRHTAATLMLQQGVPVHIVSKHIGHSKPSTTLDVYAHWLPGDTERAVEAIEQAMKNG